MSEFDVTTAIHGDDPSASSPQGYIDRKELASFAFERTGMPMVITDAKAQDQPIVMANSAFLKLTGYAADEVIGRNCRFLQGPGSSPVAVAAIRASIVEERESTVELLNYRHDGSPFWNRLHLSPILGDDGRLAYIFASQVDVSEQRRIQALEASEHRLLKEVDHRAKNVMAIVESIVRLSKADDPVLYASAIQQRVQALAGVHSLLAERGWNAVSLEQVVHQQVAPFAENRLMLEGPQLMVPASIVQPLGLVLHELAVNAARHGALLTRDGQVRIGWRRLSDGSGFELDWVEKGPPKNMSGSRSGFGSLLMAAMIEKQLNGRLERSWLQSGLELRIRVPTLTSP